MENSVLTLLNQIEEKFGELSLKTSLIWNVSENRAFPLELWKHPKIKIQVNNIGILDLSKIQLRSQEFNILFLQLTRKEWKSIQSQLKSDFDQHPFLSLIIVYSEDGVDEIQESVKANSKYLVLETPIRSRELRLILDRTIQAEFYKSAALEMGNSCLENVGFFEGVFSLAHKEYEDSKKESDALRSIFEYEEHVKKSQLGINNAMDRVNDLKNQEVIELHERVKASEHLDELRALELKQAFELQKATEQVLDYSRIEEMNLDKILKAQDRLFEYSEQEIKDLISENKELRRKLGIT